MNHDMTAMEYWDEVGRDTMIEVCLEAGTEYDYFKHIANLRKRPSADLAYKLIEACHKITPEYAMSFEKLMIKKEEMRRHGKAPQEAAA